MNITAETKPAQNNNSKDISAIKARLDRIFEAQNEHRFHVARTTAKHRIQKLKQMLKWILSHRSEIHSALKADFRKPEAETDLSEILVVTSEIRHAISHLKSWMKPKRVDSSLLMLTTSGSVMFEPRGLVLIIAPWNFPFNLTVGPLVSAVSAGNCVILKPSEFTPATSSLIGKMISEIFPENEVAQFEGDKDVSTLLFDKPFHHIFFTGSPMVGKIVQAAAAKHLTTVTLELGGKSPVIIDKSVNMNDAVKKIAWGKFMNNGQTCIAPDYALVHKDRYEEFISKLKDTVIKYYGETEEDRKKSPHYARIINARNHERLSQLIKQTEEKGAKIEIGGIADESEQYLSPTLLSNVSLDSPIMQEEIFGPVLPVIKVESLQEAVSIVQKTEKPLALYIFSTNSRHVNMVLSETTSGGACVNETLIHFLHPNLPFGGVNFSGSGNSHGYYGFKAFSHERAILKHHALSPMKMLYPPYTNFVQKLTAILVRFL